LSSFFIKLFLLAGALPALILFFLQSCSKTDCISDELRFSLIGFTDREADSILLRKFVKGGNFNVPVDSAYLDIEFRRSNDTLNVSSRLVNIPITAAFDYEMYFPVAGKTYRLTEINEEKTEQKKSIFNNTKELCINPVTVLKINNIIIVPPFLNHFYLHK
jgi:hypothetical protein